MSAEAKIVTAPGTISPKVFFPLLVGVVLVFVATFLGALTPEMLSALGPMAVPMAVALTQVANTVAGYQSSDELRALGVKATAAVIAVGPTSQVVPEVAAPVEVEPVSEPVSVVPAREQSISEQLAARGGAL